MSENNGQHWSHVIRVDDGRTVHCVTCDEVLTVQRPLLAENAAEAMQHVAADRSWPSLKESKSFDTQRLNESPLFRKGLF